MATVLLGSAVPTAVQSAGREQEAAVRWVGWAPGGSSGALAVQVAALRASAAVRVCLSAVALPTPRQLVGVAQEMSVRLAVPGRGSWCQPVPSDPSEVSVRADRFEPVAVKPIAVHRVVEGQESAVKRVLVAPVGSSTCRVVQRLPGLPPGEYAEAMRILRLLAANLSAAG
ncbi:hypothetical protein ACGF12_28550 [Kitasatospora sp. NPDC048296]|uniref:hypothetical protein n=1 Tax=Kitasatospora sp. NPDC048296 TaxID=3364048 RepID=UPI003718A370